MRFAHPQPFTFLVHPIAQHRNTVRFGHLEPNVTVFLVCRSCVTMPGAVNGLYTVWGWKTDMATDSA
jgi:hypothetical protein